MQAINTRSIVRRIVTTGVAGLALLSITTTVLSAQSPPWRTTTATPVMEVAGDAVAYDFSATAISPAAAYLSLFHSEGFDKSGSGCWGDSVSARYAMSVWNPIASFGTHLNDGQDALLTRTSGPSEYMDSPSCFSLGGAANPTLLYDNNGAWGVFYIGMRQEELGWKHHLMLALVNPNKLLDISNSEMWYLDKGPNTAECPAGTQCLPGETFTLRLPDSKPALVYRDIPSARPAHEAPWDLTPAKRVSSAMTYPDGETTLGLLGSFSYDATQSHLYFFDTEWHWNGAQYAYQLRRREATKAPAPSPQFYLSEWTPPSTIVDGIITSATYPPPPGHAAGKFMVNWIGSPHNKYVVLYNCYRTDGITSDICLQTSEYPNLTGSIFQPWQDADQFGLGVHNDFPPGSMLGGQFNIRRNGYGHHFSDSFGDIIVYFPLCTICTQPGDYGRTIYAKRVWLQ